MPESNTERDDVTHLYNVGDRVRILVGPFTQFNATIEAIDRVARRARVLVHIFAPLPNLEFNLADLAPDPDQTDTATPT